MKFELKMDCDNSAFEPDHRLEIARILVAVADRMVNEGRDGGVCVDVNGNRVGEWEVTD